LFKVWISLDRERNGGAMDVCNKKPIWNKLRSIQEKTRDGGVW
jgi:hypothetical protein